MIVVDASALLEFLLQTPLGTRVEARLFRDRDEFHAPHLVDMEVTQGLRRLVRAGEVSPARAAEAAGQRDGWWRSMNVSAGLSYMTLSARDLLPMFRATNIVDDAIVDYRDIWQRSNLLLIAVPPEEASDHSLAQLGRDLAGNDTAVVVTTDPIPGVPPPAVVVADRWGEIQYIQTAGRVADLPDAAELADWLDYVRYQCPECQGEAR